jgi:hypothetical protein
MFAGDKNMVNEQAQLYTIEGVAAAVIMLTTVYLMLNTTTLYTPADTHVTDMQLAQLGNDALAMMDAANSVTSIPAPATDYQKKMSNLENFILFNNIVGFNNEFDKYVNSLYDGSNNIPQIDHRAIQWESTIYYRGVNKIDHYSFGDSSTLLFGKERVSKGDFIKIYRWVHLDPNVNPPIVGIVTGDPMRMEDQVVLLEVLLWRD